MSETIRILLADDHKVVRKSWKMILENNPRFDVIADCANGDTAIEQVMTLKPELLLLDFNYTRTESFEVIRKIREIAPEVKVIALSVNNIPKYAAQVMQTGVKGYLTKTSPLDEITHAILEVQRGEMYVCREVWNKLSPEEIRKLR